MKTRIAILTALATTAVASIGTLAHAGSSSDYLPGTIPAPLPTDQVVSPKLFPAEQGAFKAMEVMAQLLEARIVQKGCASANFPVEVHTYGDGSGKAVISDLNGGSVGLNIYLKGSKAGSGRIYSVEGPNSYSTGTLGGLYYADIYAKGSFNIGSSIQELSTTFQASSDVTTTKDYFSGTVIKDYYRLYNPAPIPTGFTDYGTAASTVVDAGLQQISKNWFVRAKYWQTSRFWRQDGVNAGVWWTKTRIAPAGGACQIEFRLEGFGQEPADNIEGFNEKGWAKIYAADVGPFKAN